MPNHSMPFPVSHFPWCTSSTSNCLLRTKSFRGSTLRKWDKRKQKESSTTGRGVCFVFPLLHFFCPFCGACTTHLCSFSSHLVKASKEIHSSLRRPLLGRAHTVLHCNCGAACGKRKEKIKKSKLNAVVASWRIFELALGACCETVAFPAVP